jgi:hypothetical protein
MDDLQNTVNLTDICNNKKKKKKFENQRKETAKGL